MKIKNLLKITVAASIFFMINANAERIKDITSIAGVRSNQLVGYGLVVGLDGTGDQTGQTEFTLQSFRSMLNQFGIKVPDGVNIQLKNVAAVALSAELNAFAKPGQTIDVTVSSIGNAKSLRGGVLLLSPLRGADGNVYAMAQGNLIVGGFSAAGGDGSSVTVNIPSVGRVPNGATVERIVPSPFHKGNFIVFNLDRPDFTTAKRISSVINKMMGPGTASPMDSTSVKVNAPKEPSQRVSYLSVIENLIVKSADGPAKVIVNSRTGTIVIGKHVRVSQAAVSHGNLTVTITEDPLISQPNAFAGGTTQVVNRADVNVAEENNKMFLLRPGTSLQDIVRAVNAVGASPSDLMAILEALKQAGALHAELISL